MLQNPFERNSRGQTGYLAREILKEVQNIKFLLNYAFSKALRIKILNICISKLLHLILLENVENLLSITSLGVFSFLMSTLRVKT